MNFDKIFNLFIDERKLTAKTSTVSQYYTLGKNHILYKFKDRDIDTISECELIQHILAERYNNLIHKDEPLSQKTIGDITILINLIFKYAYKNNYTNKSIHISPAKPIENKVQVFNIDEKNKIKNYIFNAPSYHGIAVLLCLYAGLRIGEVCALKWDNIDFVSNCIYISETVQRIKNLNPNIDTKTKIIISTPKSKTSIRCVPIPEFLIPLLVTSRGNNDCYIASNTTGFIEPRLLQKKYKTILKKSEVNYKNFHVLRHSFATNACNNGMNPKILSEILGHANVETTLRLYVHTSLEQKQKEMNRIYRQA